MDSGLNDPSIIRNTSHVDFNAENLDNARFVKVNSMPPVGEHITAKYYVDKAISGSLTEPKLVENNQDNDFNNYNLANLNSIALNTQAVINNQIITKTFVGQFYQKIERSRRALGIDFYNGSTNLVENNHNNNFNYKKFSNLDNNLVNRQHISDNELANRKIVDNSLNSGNILKFNQTLKNFIKISVGNDVYFVIKNDKIQITDTSIMKHPQTSGYRPVKWVIKCNDKNNNGKIQNLSK